MQMRSDIQLTALIRAMKDVVIPAVDPNNRLAVEQGQLVLGMLALMQKQLPVQFRFDRDELKRLVETAGQLAGDCAGEAGLHDTAASLAALREETAKTLAGCSVDPAALHADVVRLREAIGELVTRAGESASPAVMQRVQQRVIEMSREQTLRDRSLMAPQGWEAGLPAIETLLDGSRHP